MLVFRKPNFPWKNFTTKPILYGSACLVSLLTLLSFSEMDKIQRLAIATGATTPAIASLVMLGYQNNQLKQKKEQAEQEISQLERQLQQQKQAYCDLQKEYQQMETWLTEENEQIFQSKNKLEQQFQQQENQYCQEIEKLEHTNKKLEQDCLQLEQQIKQLKDENQALKKANNSLNQPVNQGKSSNQFKVALIGGHPKACERVRNQLENEYSFKQCRIIPNDNHQVSLEKIQSIVKDANHIFMVTGYNQNSLRQKLNRLKKSGQLKGKITSISQPRGSQGIVREILNQVSS